MFSVLVNVSIAPGQFEAARSQLRERVVFGRSQCAGLCEGLLDSQRRPHARRVSSGVPDKRECGECREHNPCEPAAARRHAQPG